MTFNLKLLVTAIAAVAALGSSVIATAGPVQPEGLQGTVAAAERFRGVQEGAAAIKLSVASTSAGAVAGRDVSASKVEAERAGRTRNVEAEKRAPGWNVEAEKRAPGWNVEAEKRAPGWNVEAEKRAPGWNVEAQRKADCC